MSTYRSSQYEMSSREPRTSREPPHKKSAGEGCYMNAARGRTVILRHFDANGGSQLAIHEALFPRTGT
jgi:hypothetical protein